MQRQLDSAEVPFGFEPCDERGSQGGIVHHEVTGAPPQGFLRRVSESREECGVGIDQNAVVELGDDDRVGARVEYLGELLLALPERFGRALAVRDVHGTGQEVGHAVELDALHRQQHVQLRSGLGFHLELEVADAAVVAELAQEVSPPLGIGPQDLGSSLADDFGAGKSAREAVRLVHVHEGAIVEPRDHRRVRAHPEGPLELLLRLVACLLRPDPIGDVGGNADRSGHPSIGIPHRCDPRFEGRFLVGTDPVEHLAAQRDPVRLGEFRSIMQLVEDGMPHDFPGALPEGGKSFAFGNGDDAVGVDTEQHDRGARDDRMEPLLRVARRSLETLLLRDVFDHRHRMGEFAAGVAHAGHRDTAPHHCAVLAPVALFHRVPVVRTGDQRREAALALADVVCQRHVAIGFAAQLLLGIAKKPLQRGIGVCVPAGGIDDGDPDRRRLEHGGIACFALAQGVLRALACFLRPLAQNRRRFVEVLAETPQLIDAANGDRPPEVTLGNLGDAFLEIGERIVQAPPQQQRHERRDEHAEQQPPPHRAHARACRPGQRLFANDQVLEAEALGGGLIPIVQVRHGIGAGELPLRFAAASQLDVGEGLEQRHGRARLLHIGLRELHAHRRRNP